MKIFSRKKTKDFLYITVLFVCCSSFASTPKYVKTKLIKTEKNSSENYLSATFDGAWCWFSDPRSVYYENKHRCTYTGWIDSFGNIFVASYNHDTHQQETQLVYHLKEKDDHNNPSLLFDKEGHLLLFFSKHSTSSPIHLLRAKEKESIKTWNHQLLELNDVERYASLNHGKAKNSYTYTHPIQLQSEQNKLFLFWRGIDGKPTVATSKDNGQTWSKGKIFFMPENTYAFRRPYTKVYSKGNNKIHIIVTDGHPRNEKNNNVYYLCYKDGAYFKADGSKIKNFKDTAILPKEADKVYDASINHEKAWVWDVAEDQNGNPVIAYTKYPNDSTHLYCIATWNGKKWINETLVNSGSWFPKTPKGKKEREPNYSGGMSIDKENPNILYLSVKRKNTFEIEKWTRKKRVFQIEALTANSKKDNIRPAAVNGAQAGNPIQVIWMQNSHYIHYTDFHASIKYNIKPRLTGEFLNKEEIINKMKQVADWQLANIKPSSRRDWQWGAFYVGLEELYKITNDRRYLEEIKNRGEQAHWEPLADFLHADRMTITDVWLSLYEQEKDMKYIDKTRFACDFATSYGTRNCDLTFSWKNPQHLKYWSWCDALYMAPPTYAHLSKITKNHKYLDFMTRQWKKVSQYLYSKEDSLYYRDDTFFEKKTSHGKKVFWGRGNGWVIGGLTRVLDYMPKNDKERPFFEGQYKEMMHKIIQLQRPDSLWTCSLLDAQELPMSETSGSAFFTYGLLWGINNGILDKKYKPAAIKAWVALTKRINEEGRLGYVQQVASKPYPFYDYQWKEYASGTYFLAGREMLKMLEKE